MAASSPAIGVSEDKLMGHADLTAYVSDTRACWVQDIDQFRMLWANAAAARVLEATSIEQLCERDLHPLSAAAATRLETYRVRAAHGEVLTTQWTTFPNGAPITILADIRGFRLPDGRVALFFAARLISAHTCAESLRMLEAARQSSAFFSLFDFDGAQLEHNAAFFRTFGDLVHSHDAFSQVFADDAAGPRVRGTVMAAGKFNGRTMMATTTGPRWHMLHASRILDPVTGVAVMHFESFDVHEQVEAESRARDAEAMLQRISDEFPHPVAYIDNDRRFRFVNKTYSRWLQRQPAEIIGKTINDVVGDRADSLWTENLPKLDQRQRANYDRRTNYPGQGERWMSVDIVPFADEKNTLKGAFVFGYDVHALKIAQENALTSEAELRIIADGMPLAICKYDLDRRIRFANEPFCRWFGIRREAMIGRDIRELLSPQNVGGTRQWHERALAGETVQRRERIRRNERDFWFDISLSPIRAVNGRIEGFLVVFADVTRKVAAKAALSEARNSLASHMENTPLGVLQLDANLQIKQWSGRATDIFLWRPEETVARSLADLRVFEVDGRMRFEEQLRALQDGRTQRFTAQFRNVRRDGTSVHAEWYGSVLRNEHDAANSYLLLVQDISARVTAEGHLQYVANHDQLTGLANRHQFRARLESEVSRAARQGHHLAVALINIDRFKYVNDSLGHQAGDALLQLVGKRLKGVIRENDLLARSAGDEFVVFLDLGEYPQRAGSLVDVIAKQLAAPLRVAEQDVFVTASIGVALYPEDGEDPNELLKNADWAMFRAKDAGRNNIQFFARSATAERPFRLSTESELRRALERDELELYFQPKVDILSGLLVGAEALLRWRHTTRGLVPPDLFIPLAEDTGLIVEIGTWVTAEACRRLAEWRSRFGYHTQIAINFSAVQLRRKTLATEVLRQLKKHNLPGSALMVEVTETSLVTDPILAADTLEALRAEGVCAAIDDFGKGFSSLIQLKRLPIDELKIDSSFIHEIVSDRDDAAIVQAIIGLAHNLDLRVVAEGVETDEQLAFLQQAKCDEAQGYLIARPMTADDFAENFLRERARILIL